jgi:hypothetical protein
MALPIAPVHVLQLATPLTLIPENPYLHRRPINLLAQILFSLHDTVEFTKSFDASARVRRRLPPGLRPTCDDSSLSKNGSFRNYKIYR